MPNKIIYALLFSVVLSPSIFAQQRPIPLPTLLQIVKSEDERRWDDDLRNLLSSRNPSLRSRAALAAGRIGNEDAVSALTPLLEKDADMNVRAMAAFALGEIESETAANALIAVVKNAATPADVRARAVEALGKIAAALPREQEPRQRELGAAILEALNSTDQPTILLGLTAALRARPANAGPAIAKFLTHTNPRVRADAANALARLRLKDGNDQLRKLVASDLDPVVRGNAARVLGVTEDKQSFEPLVTAATKDTDARVRV
ncbi:MAG TPA: HEAT repeat domain-containing protein, partial [Pyrinomonadaceae bacterium]|nr:HEAT repeat domain-containing protein [Pyrinomonadaceae bacterium]